MSEKADFEAEVKALEEFQKVSSPSPHLTQLTNSNPVSRELFDRTPPLMSFRREVLYL